MDFGGEIEAGHHSRCIGKCGEEFMMLRGAGMWTESNRRAAECSIGTSISAPMQ